MCCRREDTPSLLQTQLTRNFDMYDKYRCLHLSQVLVLVHLMHETVCFSMYSIIKQVTLTLISLNELLRFLA